VDPSELLFLPRRSLLIQWEGDGVDSIARKDLHAIIVNCTRLDFGSMTGGLLVRVAEWRTLLAEERELVEGNRKRLQHWLDEKVSDKWARVDLFVDLSGRTLLLEGRFVKDSEHLYTVDRPSSYSVQSYDDRKPKRKKGPPQGFDHHLAREILADYRNRREKGEKCSEELFRKAFVSQMIIAVHESGLSLYEIADRMNSDRKAIHRLLDLNETANPTIRGFARLVAALGFAPNI